MDDRIIKFRVGVVVLATLIVGGILILLFSDARSVIGGYTIHMHFEDAPGVSEGTPVRKSGILIGRVKKVQFADRQGGVIVDAVINDHVKLYSDEVPQVSGSILGGDVVIQFIRRSKLPPSERPGGAANGKVTAVAAGGQPVPAENPHQEIHGGDYIEGTVAPNAFQVIGNLETELGSAINSMSTAGAEVGRLAAGINKILENNDEQLNRIVNKTETTLDSFQRMLSEVEDVLGNAEVRDSLKRTISDLPQLLTDTRGAVGTIKTTVESVDRNLRNMEGFTGPLGERGPAIVANIDQGLARLDNLLTEMSDFGRKLNSGEGSLGMLMRNPDLYQHLNRAALNIERLTCELQPIIADARVFADKIARHPEVLGVRGAIQKSPGTK